MAMNEFVSTVIRMVLEWQSVHKSSSNGAIHDLHNDEVADDQEE